MPGLGVYPGRVAIVGTGIELEKGFEDVGIEDDRSRGLMSIGITLEREDGEVVGDTTGPVEAVGDELECCRAVSVDVLRGCTVDVELLLLADLPSLLR